jgi:hypothetical protein
MAKIDTYLKRCMEKISEEIEGIKKGGEVAREGINIVKYNAYDRDWGYEYYRLVSREPIFKGKNGRMVTTQHLGDEFSLKTRQAIASIKRRKKLKILQEMFVYMEEKIHELEAIDQ